MFKVAIRMIYLSSTIILYNLRKLMLIYSKAALPTFITIIIIIVVCSSFQLLADVVLKRSSQAVLHMKLKPVRQG